MKNRFLINLKPILSAWMKIVGVIFTIIGIIGSFVSIPDIISFKFVIILIASILLVSLIISIIYIFTFNNCVNIYTTPRGKNIYVKYGNLLDKSIISNDEKNIVVIPVNRCFDVIANDELVSKTSIHGQCLDLLIPDKYSIEGLNRIIQEQLDIEKIDFDFVNKLDKPQGNLRRYPAGTIVQIQYNNIIYYFLALSYFDSDLHANTSEEEYNNAINSLLKYYSVHSQGYPIAIPLIGSGASNTNKNQVDILNYLVSLLKLNNSYINSDIHIIVDENQKNNIAITNLCK